MKSKASLITLAALAVGGSLFPSFSQEVFVDITDIQATLVGSPDFGSQLTIRGKKPRFEAKDWLEAEVELTFAAPKSEDGYIDDIEVSFYVLLKGGGKEKNIMVTSVQTFKDVPVGESVRAAAYLSPAMFQRLTGEKKPSKSLVQGIAVEVKHSGTELKNGVQQRGMPNAKAQPWKNPDATSSGDMLPRSRTPYADLFYDVYLQPND